MRFTGEKAVFGRHETFALRYGWLTKGTQALMSGDPVFEAEDATVRLGVGKNMVTSIRYWLQAARLIVKADDGWKLTDTGAYIFDDNGCDPYLEDEATIWLVHWLIASNPELATSWWWFFNRFHKPEFTATELVAALQDFAREEVKGRYAGSTLKSDTAVLLRMYVRSAAGGKVPAEEALDSPLAVLGLVSNLSGPKTFESRPAVRKGLPPGILGFAIVELLSALNEQQIPIEELMYGRVGYPAIGGLFRLTEAGLLGKIEELARELPDLFSLRESAGIHQLYLLRKAVPTELLDYHYSEMIQDTAA
ncbi:DUF4007 family protein [Candidatus Thiosymbion oneisti]|uniref:DUF4007 family protein n=1 Tax=Candidatus Thiosymbion oneisti TaxID=589554 RepID=UPI000A7A6107|nr:DUF4007 family protein [Candidatus Thiosymbion oneisti]